MSFKKCPVVMLPTNQKSRLFKGGGSLNYISHPVDNGEGWRSPQHLYILSDEEIKEGDWVYNEISKEIYQFKENYVSYEKKIIATTDKSLGLPQPSQSFIKKFVEEYNKGNIITEVMVEYINIMPQSNGLRTDGKIIDEIALNPILNTLCIPIINPKDNTITIRKVKDSWSREEIRSLKNKLISLSKEEQMRILNTVESFDKWIEENL